VISERARKQLKADVTDFFGGFQKPTLKDGSFNLTVGNVVGVKHIEKILNDFTLRDLIVLNKYAGTQGHYSLNEKLTKMIYGEIGVRFDPEEIIITSGASDGLSHAMHYSCEAGEKCMYALPAFPYWSSVYRSGCLNQGVVFRNIGDFSRKVGTAFAENIKKDKRIKSLILNSPQNPIGQNVGLDQVKIVNEASRENDVEIIVDDVYRCFSDEWVGSKVDPCRRIVVDSLSKRFALPGLRLGFVALPKDRIPPMRASCANKVVCQSTLSMAIADNLLEVFLAKGSSKYVVDEINSRRKLLVKNLEYLKSYGIDIVGDNGMYINLMLGNFCGKYKVSQERVISELGNGGVKVLSGNHFYPYFIREKCNFIRLSVGGESRIEEAAEKIVQVIEKLSVT